MLGAIGGELAIILILVLANGFFAASEIAIVSARRSRLEAAVRGGSHRAAQALALAENPDRFLATVQVGISLIGTFAAAFGGARISEIVAAQMQTVPALAPYAETVSLLLVVVLITYLSLILGELVPKRLGLQHAERMALVAAPVMAGVAWIARPIIAVLTFSVGLVLRLLRQHAPVDNLVTEDDIVYMVQEGKLGGTVEAGEAKMINRVFRFTDRPARTVMTPRTEIVALPATNSVAEALSVFKRSGYTRLPVYQSNIDHIVGILHAKDLLGRTAAEHVDLLTLVRPPVFVLEHQHIDDLLSMFRRQGTHMAAVIDEYGQVAGLLTLEDLLEEIVGEIQDEHDTPADQPFIQREDGSWLIDGTVAYDVVRDRFGLPATPPDEYGEYTTLAGLLLVRLGHIPQAGDRVELGNVTLEVIDMDGRRVDKILLQQTVAE